MPHRLRVSAVCPIPPERATAAFAELVQGNRRLVYAVVFSVVHRADIAEDLTQEVLLRALQRSWQFDPTQGNLGQWLTGIARHHALDSMKMERHLAGLPVDQRIDESADLEAHLVESHKSQWVRAAVSKLDHDQREIIQLAYFQELSQPAIAEQLHKPLGTVKGRMRAALRKLRDVLRNESY